MRGSERNQCQSVVIWWYDLLRTVKGEHMDFEMQNEMNRTRHILKIKQLMRVVKDKRSFERQLLRMEKMMKFRMRMSR